MQSQKESKSSTESLLLYSLESSISHMLPKNVDRWSYTAIHTWNDSICRVELSQQRDLYLCTQWHQGWTSFARHIAKEEQTRLVIVTGTLRKRNKQDWWY